MTSYFQFCWKHDRRIIRVKSSISWKGSLAHTTAILTPTLQGKWYPLLLIKRQTIIDANKSPQGYTEISKWQSQNFMQDVFTSKCLYTECDGAADQLITREFLLFKKSRMG